MRPLRCTTNPVRSCWAGQACWCGPRATWRRGWHVAGWPGGSQRRQRAHRRVQQQRAVAGGMAWRESAQPVGVHCKGQCLHSHWAASMSALASSTPTRAQVFTRHQVCIPAEVIAALYSHFEDMCDVDVEGPVYG